VREKKDIRLFFALWPDEALRRRLQEAAMTFPVAAGGRRVSDANLHLTLHFIGNVYFEQMNCLRAAARNVNASGFDLTLDVQGFFKKPQVAWLGCARPPVALGDLHRQLGRCLQTCEYQPEARPYHPHVTVARKSGSVAADACFAPIEWPVTGFALIEVQAIASGSITKGVQYRALETYPLN
jgi:2'-5' RNA ligase